MDTVRKMDRSLLVAALLVVVVAVYASSQLFTPTEREYVEVRDYQGVRLSSIADFRENSIRGPQRVNTTGYLLNVTGMVGTPVQYSYGEVLGFDPVEKVVTLDCVEGWSATVLWEGIRVTDLVEAADPSPDAETVIFHAEDGYTTSLPLEYLRMNDIIIAYKVNGVTLPDENGFPFQLVAESKWGYKWIRWITALELSDDTDYRGYWESRGYSNTADLGESFWER